MSFLKKIFGGGKKEKEPTPQEKLQAVIDSETEKLRVGLKAVEASASRVRELTRARDASCKDVNTLQARVNKAIDDGDDEVARKNLGRLNSEKAELCEKEEALVRATKQHSDNQRTVEEYNKAIKATEDQAKQLNINLNLAELAKNASSFKMDTSGVADATAGVQQQINQAEAEAEINNSLTEDPNAEFIKSLENPEEDLDAQLAAMKAAKGNG